LQKEQTNFFVKKNVKKIGMRGSEFEFEVKSGV